MSGPTATKLLMQRYNSVSPGVTVVFPNMKESPVQGVPWERVDYLDAQTENPSTGDNFKRDIGIMQVTLHYPRNAGAGQARIRAKALCDGFKRGLSLAEGTQTLRMLRSPWAVDLPVDPSWFRIAVSIPYTVDIFE